MRWKKRIVLCCSLIASSGLVHACMWDYDTLAQEIKGLPTTADAIMGRVETYPREYYARRIEIAELKLKSNPNDYEAYDNISVAYDRLGDGAKAIDFISRKRKRLEANGVKPTSDPKFDPWYRYHANYGTFLAHDFFRTKGEIALLDQGIAELEKAVKINPQAHFGREVVQIELLKTLREVKNGNRDDYRFESFVSGHDPKEVGDAVIAIMTLGGGPDSPDLLSALSYTIGHDNSYLAMLIENRLKDLEPTKGKPMIEPNGSRGQVTSEQQFTDHYPKMTANVVAFRKNLEEYVLNELRKGKHPDTHSDFWNGYRAVPAYRIPETPALLQGPERLRRQYGIFFFPLLGVLLVAVVGVFLLVRKVLKGRSPNRKSS